MLQENPTDRSRKLLSFIEAVLIHVHLCQAGLDPAGSLLHGMHILSYVG